MTTRLGFRYGALLALLPLGAFLSGPAASSIAPDMPRIVLLSVLPTFLPVLALGSVGLLAYRKTRSFRKSVLATTFVFLVGIVSAAAYLIAVWLSGG
jgi:hypothetical protein